MLKFILLPVNSLEKMFSGLGNYMLLMGKLFRSPKSWNQYFELTLDQMMIIGTNSIPIIILTATFSGMVTSVQAAYQFSNFIPDWYVGSVVGESVLLELAPVITGLVLTGRVGATIAAEIGTMRVTEQIDALESLSFDPVLYLVFPRIIAGVFMFPILVIIADFCGVFGGLFSATVSMDVSTYDFFKGFKTWYHPFDAWYGLIKAIFFGFAITSIACYQGYNAEGGAHGVGRATTLTVVISCVMVVVLDYILSAILL